MRWSVGKKLYTGFILQLLMIVIVGFIGTFGMNNLNNKAQEITTSWLPGVESINKVNYLTEHIRALEYKYTLVVNEEDFKKINNEMEETFGQIEQEFNNYEKTIFLDEDRTYFNRLKKDWLEYKDIHEEVLLIGEQMDVINGAGQINGDKLIQTIDEADKAFQEMEVSLDALVKLNHDGALKASSEGAATYETGKKLTLLVIIIAVLFGLIVAYILTQMITRPLLKIRNGVKEVAEGNLTNLSVVVKNCDELGDLAKDFNVMNENLSNLVRQAGVNAQQVAAASEQLSASAEQTTEATNHIVSLIQEAAAGSDFQVKGAEDGAKAVEEMAIGIQRIAEAAASASDSTVEVSKQTGEGNEVVQDAVNQMETIRQAVNDSERVIKDLGVHSKEIGNIIEVITGIADQTNLLALNAAIESARAGEHGRGFAVVADEVRKLAEQSRNSAQQISLLIEEIQNKTSHAVEQMEKGSIEVGKGTIVVQKAGDMFSIISRSVIGVGSQIEEVSAISEQIAAGSEEVTATIEELARIAKESSETFKGIAASSEETLATIEEISFSTTSLSEMSQELQNEINKFKI